MTAAKCRHEASVSEYQSEEELLKKWAKWVKQQRMVVGYGVNALRTRTGGETLIHDDLADRIDTAICLSGPYYKTVIKQTYLVNNHDYERDVRAALDAFRSAFDALESVDLSQARVRWWRDDLIQ